MKYGELIMKIANNTAELIDNASLVKLNRVTLIAKNDKDLPGKTTRSNCYDCECNAWRQAGLYAGRHG